MALYNLNTTTIVTQGKTCAHKLYPIFHTEVMFNIYNICTEQ